MKDEAKLDVKLIGLGGVGGLLLTPLVTFLASRKAPARLTLIDGDAFEPANSARMWIPRIGNKAEALRDDLLARATGTSLWLGAIPSYVDAASLPRLVHERDLVLLAVDNHETRKLVAEHCATLANVCLISGGNDGVGPDASGAVRRGTYGNVQIQWRKDGADLTPALTRFHPEIEEPRDRSPAGTGCLQARASTPQLLLTNFQVAAAMLAALGLCLEDRLPYAECCFDIAEGRMAPVLPR